MGKEDDSPAPCEPTSSTSTDSDPSEKHLNKAQFVWQIKGKYHLKCSDNEDLLNKDGEDDSSAVRSKDSLDALTEDETASDTENSSLIQDSSVSNADEAWDVTLSLGNRSRTDCPVVRWQTRQVAKACVDNTINCVLEDMGFVPLPADAEEMDDGTLEREAVSMAILCHGLQRSDHVTGTTSSQVVSSNSYATKLKNERSSLADFHDRISTNNKIKSVFYESPSSSNQTDMCCSTSSSKSTVQNGNVSPDQLPDFLFDSQNENFIITKLKGRTLEESENLCSSTFNGKSCTLVQDLYPDFAIDSVKNAALSEFSTKLHRGSLPPIVMHSDKAKVIPPFRKRKAEDVTSTETSKRCCDGRSSSPSKMDVNTSLSDDSSSEETSAVQTLYEKASSSEHFDFMDAAVAAAIQKKGLSTMTCTEYG